MSETIEEITKRVRKAGEFIPPLTNEIKKIIDTAVREAVNVSKKSSTVISKADEPKSDSEVELAQAITKSNATENILEENLVK